MVCTSKFGWDIVVYALSMVVTMFQQESAVQERNQKLESRLVAVSFYVHFMNYETTLTLKSTGLQNYL